MKGIDFAPYALNLKKIDVGNIVSLINWFNNTLGPDPDLQTATLSWAQYPTAGFARYPVESSAFPFRDVAVWL
jgi:fumiquinazoline A oxidase